MGFWAGRLGHSKNVATSQLPNAWHRFEILIAEFRGKLEGETERGLAIVGAAFLDDALKEFLRAYLMDDPKKVVNGLLGGSFGSFKKRCDLAYTLGLIGTDMHSDLDQIRIIRNEFAHSYSDLDFSASDVLNRCKNLKIAALSDPGKDSSARDRFIISASLLASHIVRQMKDTPHREAGKDYRVVFSDFPVSFSVADKRARRSTGDG